jgi:hypothetical protein
MSIPGKHDSADHFKSVKAVPAASPTVRFYFNCRHRAALSRIAASDQKPPFIYRSFRVD